MTFEHVDTAHYIPHKSDQGLDEFPSEMYNLAVNKELAEVFQKVRVLTVAKLVLMPSN